MVKQFILFGFCLVFFTTQSQIQKQPEWGENIKVLEETVAMFDIKLYKGTNPDIAVKIKNYSIEGDFLIVNVWKRATRQSKNAKFNLRCLVDVELTCKNSCILTILFNNAEGSDNNNKKSRIKLSNCEMISQNNCYRINWKSEDDFVKKARQAFQRLSNLNKNRE